ncbi:Uncharacterised protein [Vibrio cholerae]|nr:Uncharacterised protein [Vibrio cholerae]CSI68493.1 Uncharacterised protein [Vibrio cholerae]
MNTARDLAFHFPHQSQKLSFIKRTGVKLIQRIQSRDNRASTGAQS